MNLNHSQVPVFFSPFHQVYKSKRDHPIFDLGRIWIERKDLEFNRVELVNGN